MEKKVLFEAEWLGKVGCRHPLWSPDHLPDCHSARHDGRWRVLAMHLGGLPSHPARAVRVLPLGGASSALRRTPRGHLRLWRADQGDDPGRRDAHARQRGGGDAADGDGADADARLAQPRLLGLGLVLLRPRRGRLRPLDLAPSQGGRAGAPLLWRQGQRRAAPGATARPRTNSRRRPRPFWPPTTFHDLPRPPAICSSSGSSRSRTLTTSSSASASTSSCAQRAPASSPTRRLDPHSADLARSRPTRLRQPVGAPTALAPNVYV